MTIHKTVADLIDALSQIDQSAVPHSMDAPFTGVRLVPQNDGKILIAPPPREDKGECGVVFE